MEQDSATSAKLQQRVEVDQDKEYEKIDVPRFGPNRPATFVHDFRQVRSLRAFYGARVRGPSL